MEINNEFFKSPEGAEIKDKVTKSLECHKEFRKMLMLRTEDALDNFVRFWLGSNWAVKIYGFNIEIGIVKGDNKSFDRRSVIEMDYYRRFDSDNNDGVQSLRFGTNQRVEFGDVEKYAEIFSAFSKFLNDKENSKTFNDMVKEFYDKLAYFDEKVGHCLHILENPEKYMWLYKNKEF